MKPFVVKPISHLKGEISLLGDKSIAHRAIIISALSRGTTKIENFPPNKDCLSTVKAFKKLGIKITQKAGHSVITVFGKGLYGLKESEHSIFVGDSGTTLRLLLGVLAGQDFQTKLAAGKSLSQRPMLRVTGPLRIMGAKIKAKVSATKLGARLPDGQGFAKKFSERRQRAKIEEYPPITIRGGNLKPITYRMPVASAQVKSAILLAGLYAKGRTRIVESIKTRDHTERMLRLFGAEIKVNQNTIVIKGNKELVSPGKITIPGDISSASFFLVLAAITPNAQVLIRKIGLNPSRIGILKILKRMGADINIKYQESKINPSTTLRVDDEQSRTIKNFEPVGDLIVKSSILKCTTVKEEEIPSVIDELPILMVAACSAKGKTAFEGVRELRVKETDRIRSMTENLRKMGAVISVLKTNGSEKIVIRGVKQLKGAKVSSFSDHRTAMSMIVAGLGAVDKTQIDDISCINKSFPDFLNLLYTLK